MGWARADGRGLQGQADRLGSPTRRGGWLSHGCLLLAAEPLVRKVTALGILADQRGETRTPAPHSHNEVRLTDASGPGHARPHRQPKRRPTPQLGLPRQTLLVGPIGASHQGGRSHPTRRTSLAAQCPGFPAAPCRVRLSTRSRACGSSPPPRPSCWPASRAPVSCRCLCCWRKRSLCARRSQGL